MHAKNFTNNQRTILKADKKRERLLFLILNIFQTKNQCSISAHMLLIIVPNQNCKSTKQANKTFEINTYVLLLCAESFHCVHIFCLLTIKKNCLMKIYAVKKFVRWSFDASYVCSEVFVRLSIVLRVFQNYINLSCIFCSSKSGSCSMKIAGYDKQSYIMYTWHCSYLTTLPDQRHQLRHFTEEFILLVLL